MIHDLVVEVVSHNEMEVAQKYSEETSKVVLKGKIIEIKVKQNGESAFGIFIKDDGSIILTGYSALFSTDLNRNLILTNERPWKETE